MFLAYLPNYMTSSWGYRRQVSRRERQYCSAYWQCQMPKLYRVGDKRNMNTEYWWNERKTVWISQTEKKKKLIPILCQVLPHFQMTTISPFRDSSVGIATATGWTVRGSNPGRGEIFRTCPDRPWDPPSLLYNGYRVFPGVKSGRGERLTPHHLLVPWSRKGRAIPLLPLWAVRPVQCLSACKRVHFLPLLFLPYILLVWATSRWTCVWNIAGMILTKECRSDRS